MKKKNDKVCGLVNRMCAITVIMLMVTVVFGVGDVGGGQPSDLHTLAFLPGIAHNIDTGEQFITIQGAIDDPQTLNGHTIEVGEGTYIENVVIDKSITIIGEDKETTVIDGNYNGNVVQITVDWVNITEFTITRSSTSDSGIGLSGVQHCTIKNNNCTDNKYGIYLYDSENNTVENNNCTFNTFAGLTLSWNSNFNSIENNNLSYNVNYGIYLGSDLNTIISNNLSYNDIYGIYQTSSSYNTFSNNIMIEDGIYIYGTSLEDWNTHSIDASNTVNGKPVYYWKNQTGGTVPSNAGQVILANCINVVVEDQVLSNTTVGVLLGFSSSNFIKNNNVSNNNYGIYLLESNNNDIINNNASNNDDGIYLRTSSNSDILNNNVSNNNNGIYISQSDGNNITNNNVSNNNNGLVIYASYFNNIINNMVSYNNYDGIYISQSDGNNITYNTVSNNNDDGIYMFSSNSGNIINNTLSNNDYGFYLWVSNSNHIYHNEIIDNTIQAYDDTGTNFWNAPYPTGGNNWDDYDGLNLFSGPNQDQPGGDGFGDTPYTNIDGGAGAQDNYPLVPIPPRNFLIPVIEGWNFISTPLIGETAIPDALIDEDGDTTWTILQYYDATDPTDHWKTWAEFKPPGLNYLTSVDNTMGVWLYIPTGSLGDGLINVTGYQPLSTIINLKQGWNLVGYPSATSRSASVALSGTTADIIAVYDSLEPYKIRDTTLLFTEWLSEGNAYWVHVTSDCIWQVDP